MSFLDWEERIRRYVHVEALLKHVVPSTAHNADGKVFSAVSTQKLIEYASRSQAGKWRKYAQPQNGGCDRSPRIDAS
jgi:hypothetical protein